MGHQQTCAANQVCSDTLKTCATCEPSKGVCKGRDVYECTAQGTVGGKLKSCAAACFEGACDDPCSRAENSRSYIGCNYWPTVTPNGVTADFEFAVVVANPNEVPADITVASASNPSLKVAEVKPQSIETIILPWVETLKTGETVIAKGSGYQLKSTLPVSVYQFSPLGYVKNYDCKKGNDPLGADGKCFSYTNDASLLLPANAFGHEYRVISRATRAVRTSAGLIEQSSFSPGFFTVVATAPGESRVAVTFTGATSAGSGSVLRAYKKGETGYFTLQQWDVLQVLSQVPSTCTPDSETKTVEGGVTITRGYCDLSSTADLTGSLIKADQPVAVFSGHECAFVPFDKWACDHLEEQMIPLQSWGKRYIATHTASSGKDPGMYRIVSAADGNQLVFNPSDVHQPVTVDAGKYIEITTTKDFTVEGTEPLAVAQFMVGQNYSNLNPGAGAPGDPAMSLAVPVEQYRKSYLFLTPGTYEKSYVNVIALRGEENTGTEIILDGKPVTGFTRIGDSGYSVAKVAVAGGAHAISSEESFGISVYGVGSYTSYMYPGGLDLKIIVQ